MSRHLDTIQLSHDLMNTRKRSSLHRVPQCSSQFHALCFLQTPKKIPSDFLFHHIFVWPLAWTYCLFDEKLSIKPAGKTTEAIHICRKLFNGQFPSLLLCFSTCPLKKNVFRFLKRKHVTSVIFHPEPKVKKTSEAHKRNERDHLQLCLHRKSGSYSYSRKQTWAL